MFRNASASGKATDHVPIVPHSLVKACNYRKDRSSGEPSALSDITMGHLREFEVLNGRLDGRVRHGGSGWRRAQIGEGRRML